jgi:hypothetical protein
VQNKQKIFAFLWNQCSESVQQRIKGMSGYPDRIKNDHVELLKAIYQQCLVSNQEHYYDMKVVNDAIMNMCYFKTNKDESASEFYRRSATIRDIIVKAIGVPIHMDGVIQAEKDSEKINRQLQTKNGRRYLKCIWRTSWSSKPVRISSEVCSKGWITLNN